MNNKFDIEVFAKCILAGEHSVLRGVPALVLPVKGKSLKLNYEANNTGFELECFGEQDELNEFLFTGILDKALGDLGKSRADILAKITLNNQITIGAGMGASAAMCVSATKLLLKLGWLEGIDPYEFSRQLENLFHGESSGVDIAVAMESRAIRFLRTGTRESLEMKWRPNLYLSFSGSKGITSECVEKVKSLFIDQAEFAEAIDSSMEQAVNEMECALSLESTEGLALFQKAMTKAQACFEKWDLLNGGLKEQMQRLKENGAIAVKPTGSGDGGYVLSLWECEAPKLKEIELIPVFSG